MGYWVGKGHYIFSNEDRQAYKKKKHDEWLEKHLAQRAAIKESYFSLTELRSFLKPKDIEQHFPKPDKEIETKFNMMKLFSIKKVLAKIESKNITITIKKAFEKIENDNAKKTIGYLALCQKIPIKGTKDKKNKI